MGGLPPAPNEQSAAYAEPRSPPPALTAAPPLPEQPGKSFNSQPHLQFLQDALLFFLFISHHSSHLRLLLPQLCNHRDPAILAMKQQRHLGLWRPTCPRRRGCCQLNPKLCCSKTSYNRFGVLLCFVFVFWWWWWSDCSHCSYVVKAGLDSPILWPQRPSWDNKHILSL